MSLAGVYTETPTIFLQPRPLARYPGSFVLLPLLPRPRLVKPLPAEVWSKVLSYVIEDEDGRIGVPVPEKRVRLRERWRLLFVCKPWVEIVLPLLYSNVHIFTASAFEKFAAHLCSSDQRWDSIRRIPYSTPGRWVRGLDLSEMAPSAVESLSVDTHLTRLLPLLPSLTGLCLIPEMILSNRALAALQCKDGIGELRLLKGLKISVTGDLASVQPPFVAKFDPIAELLWHCPRLEQLEILCTDTVNAELESVMDLDLLGLLRDDGPTLSLPPTLHLPHLRYLSLSAIPICPLLLTLLRTPLPGLRHVVWTPYSDVDTTPQLGALLAMHGWNLISLSISTPRHLPISPATGDARPLALLGSCPELQYLALDHPLPALAAHSDGPPQPHPLRVLTIPRPSARFLRELEVLLPRLPALTVVRARTVRWLRAGVSGKALEAGVQGEMHEWRRRFARKGVRVVDGEWRDPV
ncbi:hypothetical protein EDB89DRAFT_1849203 [Lactarius sanguifluus]|nr:hypothetical protein EDB89DRAFT_1849203 [Lactarius sanguifluus]